MLATPLALTSTSSSSKPVRPLILIPSHLSIFLRDDSCYPPVILAFSHLLNTPFTWTPQTRSYAVHDFWTRLKSVQPGNLERFADRQVLVVVRTTSFVGNGTDSSGLNGADVCTHRRGTVRCVWWCCNTSKRISRNMGRNMTPEHGRCLSSEPST